MRDNDDKLMGCAVAGFILSALAGLAFWGFIAWAIYTLVQHITGS